MWWVAGFAAAAMIAGGIGVGASLTRHPTVPAGAEHDMRGDPVTVDPGTLPSADARKQMNATVDTHDRIVVPSVKLDAPLGAITAVDGVLTPPGFTSVYAVRNVGARLTSPDSGTVFLVTHSLRGGGIAPGNYLIDVQHQSAAVKVGAKVFVDGTSYTVTGSQAIAKPKIGDDPQLWADVPDRLVIITCLQLPSGKPSVDNMIITATRTK